MVTGRKLICPAGKTALLATLFVIAAHPACGLDWKTLTDEAVGLAPVTVVTLEGKKDKSERDVYLLTMIYYRQYHYAGLKKLRDDSQNLMPDSPVRKLLQGIVWLRERRYGQSRAVLKGVLQKHPDFFPALFVLGHQSYLEKDFEGAYKLARRLIANKQDISRYHYMAALVLAAAARGFTAPRNWIWAIPAYFEVNRLFREAKDLMPESAEVLYGLGCYHLLLPSFIGGNIDQAIVLLEKSRRLTPLNTQVYVRLAQAYRAKKDENAYHQYISRAIALDPQDELLLDYLSGEKIFLDAP